MAAYLWAMSINHVILYMYVYTQKLVAHNIPIDGTSSANATNMVRTSQMRCKHLPMLTYTHSLGGLIPLATPIKFTKIIVNISRLKKGGIYVKHGSGMG